MDAQMSGRKQNACFCLKSCVCIPQHLLGYVLGSWKDIVRNEMSWVESCCFSPYKDQSTLMGTPEPHVSNNFFWCMGNANINSSIVYGHVK